MDTPTKTPLELATVPIVVDLDMTLVRTDTLFEAFLALFKHSPVSAVAAVLWLVTRGRAAFKAEIARRHAIDVSTLPYNDELIDYLKAQRAAGRSLVLATASHVSTARAVAARLGIFDRVIGTEQGNLKGAAKARAIRDEIGATFIYAGDSRADLDVWREASAGILVGCGPALRKAAIELVPIEAEFDRPRASVRAWFRALRMHQWTKNLLLFVPLLTMSQAAEAEQVMAVSLTFIAFGLAASGTYLLNDLWDLASDRQHPRKKRRPLASGEITIQAGIAAAIGLVISAVALAAAIGPLPAVLIASYVALTTIYSLALKSYMLVDVMTLASLYTYRVFTGAVVLAVPMSEWLLAFSLFIFLSLALVKRCSELLALESAGRASATGRDYLVSDLRVFFPLGVAAGMAAVVVFGLFIHSPKGAAQYAEPNMLWIAGMAILYWIGRLWVKTSRGEMDDDPIVYALRDKASLLTLGVTCASVVLARLGVPSVL